MPFPLRSHWLCVLKISCFWPNSGSLKPKTDKQRMRAIRGGHPGKGMFPDMTKTNQELTDTLAYLALLRCEGISNKS
jgi:hypothetical protein